MSKIKFWKDERHIEQIYPEIDESNILLKNNMIEYVPSNDYNPATKKYVDEKAKNVIIDFSDTDENIYNKLSEIYETNNISFILYDEGVYLPMSFLEYNGTQDDGSIFIFFSFVVDGGGGIGLAYDNVSPIMGSSYIYASKDNGEIYIKKKSSTETLSVAPKSGNEAPTSSTPGDAIGQFYIALREEELYQYHGSIQIGEDVYHRWTKIIQDNNYANSSSAGVVKMRLDEETSTLYIRTDGGDA